MAANDIMHRRAESDHFADNRRKADCLAAEKSHSQPSKSGDQAFGWQSSLVGQGRSPPSGLRKLAAATRYNAIAITMTHVNPAFIARSVARIALSTEAQPLIPHAQGTSSGARAETRDKPSGNGIPMQNASGAISSNAMATFGASGSALSNGNSGGRANRQTSATTTMPPIANSSAPRRSRIRPHQLLGVGLARSVATQAASCGMKPLPTPAKTRKPQSTTAVA